MNRMVQLFLLVSMTAFIATACDDGGGGGGKGSHAWTEADIAPFAYYRFDAEYSYATGKVYFLGGRLADASTTGSIWEYDPATGEYNYLGLEMPYPVSNYTIARLTDGSGREVFVIFGGRDNAGNPIQTVQCFYPKTLMVTELPSADDYPQTDLVTYVPGGVAVVGNKAYVFGGLQGTTVIANTYIFDITAASGSRWTSGPDLNLARTYIAAAVVDGVIYAIGGDIYSSGSLVEQTMVEKLDTTDASPAWNDVDAADLPFACDETQAFGFDSDAAYRFAGSIIVAGCGQYPDEYEYSLVYDAATNTWDESFPDLNQARRNHAGAFIPEGEGMGRPGIWVWGGRQDWDATILRTPEYY